MLRRGSYISSLARFLMNKVIARRKSVRAEVMYRSRLEEMSAATKQTREYVIRKNGESKNKGLNTM